VPAGKFAPVFVVGISLEFFLHCLLTTGSYYTKLAENKKAQLGQMSKIRRAIKRSRRKKESGMITCLIESVNCAKIAMACRKNFSYYKISDDRNIEPNRKGRLFAANSPGLRASWKNLNLFGKSDNF